MKIKMQIIVSMFFVMVNFFCKDITYNIIKGYYTKNI